MPGTTTVHLEAQETHIRSFSFSKWYPVYARYTFPSVVLPLDPAFVSYLQSDGIQLPNSIIESGDYDMLSSSDSGNDDMDDEMDGIDDFSDFSHDIVFSQLQDQVNEAIRSLGGKVIPKLNWSAPRDACWISFAKTMECTNMDDILILLKSSDFIAFDLQHGANELVLRRWENIDASLEFRVFVRDRCIIAMCQRDIYNHYPFLVSSSASILQKIISFHASIPVHHQSSYVLDVYIRPNNTLVVDLNPWGAPTDALLFSWDELTLWEGIPELRVIETHADPRRVRDVAFGSNRLPMDMFAIGNGLTHDDMVDKFRDLCAKNVAETDDQDLIDN